MHPVEQLAIFVAHGLPVDAVHIAVVEVIAMQTPGVGELLFEFVGRNDGKRPVVEIHDGIGQSFRIFQRPGLGRCVHPPHLRLLADEHLLAVERNLEPAHIFHQGFGLVALVVDVDALQNRFECVAGGSIHPAKPIARRVEIPVIAGGYGYVVETAGDAIEIDLDFRYRLFVLLCSIGLRIRLGVGLRFGLRVGFRFRLGFGRLGIGLRIALVRLQLVGRLKWRAQTLLQGDCVDLVRPVKIRIRLARTPRTENRGPQGTVRQEIDPLPVGAP